VYPPMSDQLEAAGIRLTEGWDPAQLEPAPDLVVIGNALARGNPAVEAVLDRGLEYRRLVLENERYRENLEDMVREKSKALTNALKHARPKNVWITLEAGDDLVITFSHDGTVTDPREWSRGRGQHNLATRAGEIGGKLEFALAGDPPDRRLRARLEMKL